MRPDEEFVGHALVEFLGGASRASVSDGEDPPDLYLHVGISRIGVEVTRLSQFTFESDGRLGNRNKQDIFGIRILDKLDAEVGQRLPEKIGLLIELCIPVQNARSFKKSLKQWVEEIAADPKKGFKEERKIEGSKVTVSVIEQQPIKRKIHGLVTNKNSLTYIPMNAHLLLEDRILVKDKICSGLSKPIWLALLNDYCLADADTYADAGLHLKLNHCFERIFLVSDQGAVNELFIGA
ncbi:MAG: hypothetical protein KGO02_23965 [Alphaproteobacteria bacterium]|nr:hypothetical protein [Alphaproteobacteria bacterium]